MINKLEHQLDESKKRTSHQFDEIQKLEDQVRELNVELASVQSQADKQQQNVSPGILCDIIYVFYLILYLFYEDCQQLIATSGFPHSVSLLQNSMRPHTNLFKGCCKLNWWTFDISSSIKKKSFDGGKKNMMD